MARGNSVIVSADPQGKHMEGFLADGLSDIRCGRILQRDPTVALRGGRHTYKLYDRSADGNNPAGPLYILRERYLMGGTLDDTFDGGENIQLYTPVDGEELNVEIANISGTADDHPAGELLMVDDGTGKLVVSTGPPEQAPFQLLETITDPTADTQGWVVYGR